MQVVFVAAAYSAAKHTAALKKAGAPGVNNQAVGSSSGIAFVSPAVGTAASTSSSAATLTAAAEHAQQQQQQSPRLQQLYHQVAAAARQLLKPSQQTKTAPPQAVVQQQQQQHHQQQQQLCLTIIVDSVTVLSSLISDEQQVAAFLHHLMALGEVLQVRQRESKPSGVVKSLRMVFAAGFLAQSKSDALWRFAVPDCWSTLCCCAMHQAHCAD